MKVLKKVKKSLALGLAFIIAMSTCFTSFAGISMNFYDVARTSYVKQEELDKVLSVLLNKTGYETGVERANLAEYLRFETSLSPLLLLPAQTDNAVISLSAKGFDGSNFDTPLELKVYFKDGVDADTQIAKYKEMKAKIDAIVAAAPEDYTAKLKYFADYICDNATYDYDSYTYVHDYDCGSVEGFFNDGKVVCQGYAYTFYTLCYYAGIECALVPMEAETMHAFNAVKVDGVWKKIDACWMDKDVRDYRYFLADLSDDVINFIESDPNVISTAQQ